MWRMCLVSALAALMLMVVGCGSSETKTVTETVTNEAPAEANEGNEGASEARDEPTGMTIPDGHWERGTDFQPGTYRAPGGEECEWAQAENLNGVEVGSGNTHYGRNLLAEINDKYFRTEGCGTWEKLK